MFIGHQDSRFKGNLFTLGSSSHLYLAPHFASMPVTLELYLVYLALRYVHTITDSLRSQLLSTWYPAENIQAIHLYLHEKAYCYTEYSPIRPFTPQTNVSRDIWEGKHVEMQQLYVIRLSEFQIGTQIMIWLNVTRSVSLSNFTVVENILLILSIS